MPYIKQEDRKKFRSKLIELMDEIKTEGELNFVIFCLCKLYVIKKGESYKTYNEIMGVIESAKTEFYRKAVVPYEEKKIIENGDINFKSGVWKALLDQFTNKSDNNIEPTEGGFHTEKVDIETLETIKKFDYEFGHDWVPNPRNI